MASNKKIKARKIHKDAIVKENIANKDKAVVIDGNKKIKSRKIVKPKNFDENVIKEDKIESNVKCFDSSKEKIRTRKVRMSLTKAEEKKLDNEIERDDNMSIVVMILILVFCFVVGISLGYLLYRIAITGGL